MENQGEFTLVEWCAQLHTAHRANIELNKLIGNAEHLQSQLDAATAERDAILQEAKIHASELDTQKSIVTELCGLLGLRVHDYRCISEAKSAIKRLAIEQQIGALEHLVPMSNAVANHWCEKEQAGYMWFHGEVLARIAELRKQLEQSK